MSKKLKLIDDIIFDNNTNITNMNEINNEFLIQKLEDLNNNEPSKIFKNKHKKWEKEKELLNDKINESFNNLNENYKNLEQMIK